MDSLDTADAAIAKTKPLRASASDQDAVWIRKGYVVAAAALLSLFLLSGFLTTQSTTLTSPTVLSYLSTFSAEDSTPMEEDPDLEDSLPTDLDTELQTELQGELQAEIHPRSANREGCNERDATLKVFMYDLPPQFHYGMIDKSQQSWPRNVSALPRYPGGLYQQHSPEYWLVSDLLTSDMPDRTSPCTAYRVHDWQTADILFIPFFASLSYNKFSRKGSTDLNQELQRSLLAFLNSQPAWRARAEDHVLVIHHPNSMALMRDHFRSGIFIVADFGRYGSEGKDIVAPYKHVIPTFESDSISSNSFHDRPTLLFFQGAIVRKQGGIIRKQLHTLLSPEPDVIFSTGATTSAGIRSATVGMRSSKFCLHLAGDTPSSNRLFDAIASHCVPLVVSDEIELPFEDVLDYSEFCLFVDSGDALREGFLLEFLRGFEEERWGRMHRRLREVANFFEWQYPSERGDAVHMTWEAVGRKVPGLKLARHKGRRYERARAGVGRGM